ncbi:hypothetical protein CGMCC3_g4142 [Colletotrichum fructicola]|nr:uncharacterized protein CGMCC3_g4142 [Colletotrichum fructicola]KAE9579711.1 hypothetical protein CGMCC3_g4142 [Colletotrichum fructicola]
MTRGDHLKKVARKELDEARHRFPSHCPGRRGYTGPEKSPAPITPHGTWS